MRRIIYPLLFVSSLTHADTISHYIEIVNNIPQMEMKADSESQAWARSARNILTLTSETIFESLQLANDSAKKQGAALFCLPEGKKVEPNEMTSLIQEAYRQLQNTFTARDDMSVSEVALLGMTKQYPCQQKSSNPYGPPGVFGNEGIQMGHESSVLGEPMD